METAPIIVHEGSLLVLALAAAVALVVSAVFYAAQRRGMAALQKSVGDLGRPDHKIRYDIDNALAELQALRSTPAHLEEYGRRLDKTCDDLKALQVELPHAGEVEQMRQNVQTLCTDFKEYKTSVEDQIQKFTKSASDDFNAARDQLITDARTSIANITRDEMFAQAVPRDEFESFKKHVEKSLGADEVAQRMATLGAIFDSTQIKTINWQCKLISLLRGGLAPDAEQDAMVSSGIPQSTFLTFLKRLEQNNIIEKKSIAAYYMVPDNEWIYSYTENPDWLQKRLASTVKKERNYQDYVRDNLHLLEDGMQLVTTEYELATGRIDIMCTDSSGQSVGVELKYPSASRRDFRQIDGYRKDYIAKTGKRDARFFIVAPAVSDELRGLLDSNGLEWREVVF